MSDEPLTLEEAARIFKEELDLSLPLDFRPDKIITIITFGNAFGKGFARILNYLKKLSKENYKTLNDIYVQILAIDPEFQSRPPLYRGSTIQTSFDVPILSIQRRPDIRGEIPTPKYLNDSEPDHISSQKLENHVGFFDINLYINSKGGIVKDTDTFEKAVFIDGLVCFIADKLPSQYTERDIEFTKQILKDGSFAYADQCKPSDDHPFRHILPHIQRVLELGGSVIVDNDAWHEMNMPDKGVAYLSNLYMQYYCEVLYLLREIQNPNILFLHTDPKSITEFNLRPLDAEFIPKGSMRTYKAFNPNSSGGGTKQSRRTRKAHRAHRGRNTRGRNIKGRRSMRR